MTTARDSKRRSIEGSKRIYGVRCVYLVPREGRLYNPGNELRGDSYEQCPCRACRERSETARAAERMGLGDGLARDMPWREEED